LVAWRRFWHGAFFRGVHASTFTTGTLNHDFISFEDCVLGFIRGCMAMPENGKHGLFDEFLTPLPLGIAGMLVLAERRLHDRRGSGPYRIN
jgi:hypothetical protein